MGKLVKRCLWTLVPLAFCCAPLLTAVRLVGDPETMAAGMTGLVENYIPFDMTERGKTYCPQNPNTEFRTINGTCNNVRNNGASNTPLRRLVQPPAYEHGTLGEPRATAQSGNPLPSPRTISQVAHPDLTATDGLTVAFMQWGQFIDHDVALSPLPTEGGIQIICCGAGNVGLAHPLPEECFPIRFPPHDDDFDGDCMEFVRSEPALEDYGESPATKFREQLNALTSFVDASMVYGSEDELARELRTENGLGILLKTFDDPVQGPLLPKGPFLNCRRPNPDVDFCFLAGDIRVNEQPGLATMHTIFLRLHNLLALGIQDRQPLLSREIIFQRARKIVGAITQNILYGEWLPILLGETTMNRLGLSTGRRSAYVASLDPSILQEFSTAAYRMGHSLVPNVLLAGSRSLRLRDHFLLTRAVRESFHDIAQGLVNGTAGVFNKDSFRTDPNRARTLDQFVTQELTEHLFEVKPRRGMDLVSFNIQRGRDHGLRPYNDVRRACGLAPLESFADRAFNGSAVAALYEHPNDIDLFAGGLLEPPFGGGLVGATFNCIISTQFFLLKFGDRYFFETSQRPEGFTRTQRNAIRRITMALVMCLTTDIRMIQPNAFRVPSAINQVTDCRLLKQDWITTMNNMV